jgi:hypothetical protein
MSPLVARAGDLNQPNRPAEGETDTFTIILNTLTDPTQNSTSR